MLNDQQIKHRSEREQLIAPFEERLLQPHSYDCTLDDVVKIARWNAYTQERSWEEVNCFTDSVELKHGEFALASTKEYFKLPQGLVGFVQGKSSVGRNGLQIENAGLIDAGFSGTITLELYNMAPWPILLDAGRAICQVHFTPVDSPHFKDYSKTGHYNKQRGATAAVYTI